MGDPRLDASALLSLLGITPAASHGRPEGGNIDLYDRPKVPNPKGGTSTVYSMSFRDEDERSPRFGQEVLVPLADEGRILSEAEARQKYQKGGRHLGAFRTPEEATAYAKQLHEDYERGKYEVRPAVSHRR